jgi:hypothetical protein
MIEKEKTRAAKDEHFGILKTIIKFLNANKMAAVASANEKIQ